MLQATLKNLMGYQSSEDLFTRAGIIETANSLLILQSNVRNLVAQQSSKTDVSAFRHSNALEADLQSKSALSLGLV